MEEEVQATIKQIKQGKATGEDWLEGEFFPMLDKTREKWITNI